MVDVLELGSTLRAALGVPTEWRRLASSPRSEVWRVLLDGGPAVVKRVVGGSDPVGQFTREVTALRLAARAEPPVAPRLLGTDADQLLMVLEYVDEQPAGLGWTAAYAGALARLHATTGPTDACALPAWQPPTETDVDAFLGVADALGVRPRPVVRTELVAALDRLSVPGHGLLHGDPCPGNDLHTATGLRFVDFEQASSGNGVVELAYLHVGFPTCWCASSLPAEEIAAAEHAYRSTWYELTGTQVVGSLADACLGWLVRGDALVQKAERGTADHLSRVPVEDWSWGPHTARERLVHRLGVVARVAEGHHELTATGELAAALRERMIAAWTDLRPLPAVRPPQSMLSGVLDDD